MAQIMSPYCQIQTQLNKAGKTTRPFRYDLNQLTNDYTCVSLLSCVRLFVTPWTVVYEAPPSMGFSRQEYWSGLPFPSPGDLPDPGIKPQSPALQADTLPSKPPGKCSLGISNCLEEISSLSHCFLYFFALFS